MLLHKLNHPSHIQKITFLPTPEALYRPPPLDATAVRVALLPPDPNHKSGREISEFFIVDQSHLVRYGVQPAINLITGASRHDHGAITHIRWIVESLTESRADD